MNNGSEAAAYKLQIHKHLVAIGNDLAAELGMSRNALWAIRSGNVRKGEAVGIYWERVRKELPELFREGDLRLPHFVVREFTRKIGKKPEENRKISGRVAPIRSGRLARANK